MADEAQAPADPQWPVTVNLRFPVDFGSQRIETLVFRKGRLADLKGVAIGEMPSIDQVLLVASRLCGQPLKVIESIDADDAAEVMALAMGFIGRCQDIGSRLSR